jgi:hypothetical protein
MSSYVKRKLKNSQESGVISHESTARPPKDLCASVSLRLMYLPFTSLFLIPYSLF